MKLSIGIVGLPNVGKSTLFKAITNSDIVVANYPFATIDPNVAIVEVPDERLGVLTKISNSEKTIPAVVEFYDIAGLVKGASAGAGLGNAFLNHIKNVSAIIEVVRCFSDPNISHVQGNVDPIQDIETIKTELALKDLEFIQNQIKRLEAEVKKQIPEAKENLEKFKKAQELLSKNQSVKELDLSELLSAKPAFYLLNGSSKEISQNLTKYLNKNKADYLIADLKKYQELSKVIQKAYSILGLMSFFTSGKKETRAWTIKINTNIQKAAGAIHTDFCEKFIRAEVISYQDFVDCKGWQGAKQKGKLRTEGKDYIVKAGDIVNILHG